MVAKRVRKVGKRWVIAEPGGSDAEGFHGFGDVEATRRPAIPARTYSSEQAAYRAARRLLGPARTGTKTFCTIQVSTETHATLTAEARRRGISGYALVQEALEAYASSLVSS